MRSAQTLTEYKHLRVSNGAIDNQLARRQQRLIQILGPNQWILDGANTIIVEFIIAGCFIFPLSALWIQTQEDESNEDEIDFL